VPYYAVFSSPLLLLLSYTVTCTRGSQKVPGMVVLHNNGRTYGNAYLITFKVGPKHPVIFISVRYLTTLSVSRLYSVGWWNQLERI
jgi:hypothetical protein